MKKLMIGTALSSLMVVAALAQTPSGSSSTSPAASPKPATTSSSSAGAGNFIASQKPDQFVATKFKGTDVVGSDDQKIGTISDILFDKDGKIEAYVVAVGGFLGVGAKEVAMAPSAFQVIKGTQGSSDKLKVATTKDQLKEAQNFERYQPPRPATTGTGGPGGGMGGGGMARPGGAPSTGR
ncbi:MAG TPA: PRC-barrel domain-containing protein [Pseudolabrys sp.]|nr:PRC-barrel domain-containing protein [Pseudolabrys sp.]